MFKKVFLEGFLIVFNDAGFISLKIICENVKSIDILKFETNKQQYIYYIKFRFREA